MAKLGNITLDKVVSFTEARNNLSTLVDNLPKEGYLVMTKRLEPAAVLVDPELFEGFVELKRRQEIYQEITEIQKELAPHFDRYLRKKGYDPETITDEEVWQIIDEL